MRKKEMRIFTNKSLHHTTLVLICFRFTCPRWDLEGQEDGLVGDRDKDIELNCTRRTSCPL